MGDKALDPQYAVEVRRWASDILGSVQSVMHRTGMAAIRKAAQDMVRDGVTDEMHARGRGNPSGRSGLAKVFGSTQQAENALRGVLGPLEGIVSDAAKRHSARVMQRIRQMDAEGATIKQIQDAIRKEIGQRSSWRQQLARYLTTAVTEGAKEAAYEQAGNLVRKTWHTREDEKVRHSHRRLNGRSVGGTKRFRVGKYWMKRPLDPTGGIEETINCRCFLTYELR